MENIIEVGDEIKSKGVTHKVTAVYRGKYGIAIETVLIAAITLHIGMVGAAFLPYELPPSEVEYNWYGWSAKLWATLSNGQKVGVVTFSRSESRGWGNMDDYDAEWERTLESMKLDKIMEPQSRPFTKQSRPDVL